MCLNSFCFFKKTFYEVRFNWIFCLTHIETWIKNERKKGKKNCVLHPQKIISKYIFKVKIIMGLADVTQTVIMRKKSLLFGPGLRSLYFFFIISFFFSFFFDWSSNLIHLNFWFLKLDHTVSYIIVNTLYKLINSFSVL